MRTSLISRSATIGAIAVGLILMSTSAVYAQDAEQDFDAHIEILPTLVLDHVADLNFGAVARPDAGDVDVTIEADGTLDDGGLAHSGGDSPGEFSLSGDDSLGVNITSEVISDFSPAELELTDVHLPGDGTIDSADWTDNDQFTFGGTVNIAAGVEADEAYTAEIELTAAYE